MIWWLLAAVSPATYVEIDFAPAATREVVVDAAPVARTRPHPVGPRAGALAVGAPSLPARGSRFSTLFRARDVVDVTAWPARAVAKLYRLEADGKRGRTACTAQFVGPRHLITAGHCIVDRSKGVPHTGFELTVGHDRGVAAATHRVRRAWIARGQMRVTDPALQLVTADRCDDLAVIEISEPAGTATGWFGMTADLAPDRLLHRFSYPHQSASAPLMARAADPAVPENARKALKDAAEKAKVTEPDFSPDNLYYEYGHADDLARRYVADRNGYSTPGRSGSALFDKDGAIVALLSRGYNGTSYSCRLGAEDIGAVVAIMRRG